MPSATASVRNLSVITTGSGAIHPEHMYGTRKPALWWIAASKQFIEIPLNVFVIEHDRGLVLFDTGADPALTTDPHYWPDRVTRWFMSRIFRFDVQPDDDLATQLERAGFRADDVIKAVLSHLHFDHAGGIRFIPDAELLVADEAWQHMLEPNSVREAVLRRDIAVPGTHWRIMDFEPTDDPQLAPFTESFDVMGDGSMVVLPTPGHVPGSVSMLVRRTDAPPVLLIGDLSYSEELLHEDRLPGTGDKRLLLESFAKVRALQASMPDLVIVASHDTTAAGKIAAGSPTTVAAG